MLQGQTYNQIAMNTLANSLTSVPVYFLSIGNSQGVIDGQMFLEDEEKHRN